MCIRLFLLLALTMIGTVAHATNATQAEGTACDQGQSQFRHELDVDPSHAATNPMDVAIVHGDVDALSDAIRQLPDRTSRAQSLQNGLITAASFGNDAAVKALLKNGADANASGPKMGITPMMAAANCGHIPTMDLLLKAGARWDAKPLINGSSVVNNPFEAAVIGNEDAAALWITDHGFDVCSMEPKDKQAKLKSLANRRGMKVASRFQCQNR